MKEIIIFIGKPGSGKDTISRRVAEKLNIPLVIAGDLLREEVKRGSEIGKKIKDILERGDLVEDEIIISLLLKKIGETEAKTIILNGFPRSYRQGKIFEKKIKEMGYDIALVFELDIPDEVVYDRIVLRRVCPKCGRVYNLKFNPPKNDEKCDFDGEKLIQRDDDKEDVVKHRLEKFYEEIDLIRDMFKKEGKYYVIDADRSIEDVVKDVKKIIECVLK